MVRIRGIQNKWRDSDMEYIQELENLKEEVNRSGRKIEGLSGLMQKFSDLNELQQAIKSFREDNIFRRIESKIDIIAEADSVEALSLLIDELNSDLTQKYDNLSSKISSIEELNTEIIQIISKEQVTPVNDQKTEDLSEIKKELGIISSNYSRFLENLNDIKQLMADFRSDELQPGDAEEFADKLKSSLSGLDGQDLSGQEQKLDNLLNLLKNFESNFADNLSELDEKVDTINKNLSSIAVLDDSFISVREKIDNLAHTLKNAGLENLENLSGFNENFQGMESRIVDRITENLSELSEKLSGFHTEVAALSQISENNDTDQEVREKLGFLISIIYELREEISSGGRAVDDGEFDQVLESVQNLPKTEFVSEKLQKLTNIFDQIKVRLDDESFESEVKQGFSAIEENFERIEDILSENSELENIKYAISHINRDLRGISEQVNDNSDIEQVISNLNAISNNINEVKGNLPEKTAYDELKKGLENINSSIYGVYEELYPLQNLQIVNESFESAQEKLNTIIETLNNSDLRNQEDIFDIKSKFDNIHTHINSCVINNFAELKEKLTETYEKTEQINSDVKNESETVDQIKGEVKHLNFKVDNLKDVIDRLIKFNGNNNEKAENNFEEVKNTISHLNNEIIKTKDAFLQNISPDELQERLYDLQNLSILNQSFQAAQDKLNIIIESVENHGTETLNKSIDLENRFNDMHFHIDNQVINNISALKDCINELSGRQNDPEEVRNALHFLKHGLEDINQNLKYNIENNISREIFQSLLNDVDSIKEVVGNNLAEAKIDDVNTKLTDLDLKISNLQEISEFKESAGSIRENLSQLEEKVNYTNEKIYDFSNFIVENLSEEFSPVNEQLQSIKESLNYKFEDNTETLNQFLAEFSSRIESLQEISNAGQLLENLSPLSNSLENMSENMSALCEEVYSLKNLQEKVENIHNHMNFASSQEEIGEINSKIDSLTEEIKAYRENLDSMQQISAHQALEKLDAMETNLGTDIGEIKDLSTRVSGDVSELKTVMSDLFEAIAGMDNAHNENIDSEKLSNAIEKFEQFVSYTKPEFEELKSSSGSLSDKIDSIKSDLSGISGETREKLERFFELAKNIEAKIEGSRIDTEEVRGSINWLSQLSENQNSATNEALDGFKNEFATLSEELNAFDSDLTDINSKINKLIINSDQNTGTLNENITSSINGLRENIRQNLENNALEINQSNKTQFSELSQDLAQIHRKIEGLNSLSVKGLNSSDTLREAIIQMAEWIDSAGILLEENNENTRKNLSNVDNVLKTVSNSENKVISQIDRVCRKFEDFEVRLESIEAKIEKSTDTTNRQDEIKQMLLDVKEKFPSANNKKNENGQVLDKIDKLESQMVLFETKIQRILEFVEQE